MFCPYRERYCYLDKLKNHPQSEVANRKVYPVSPKGISAHAYCNAIYPRYVKAPNIGSLQSNQSAKNINVRQEVIPSVSNSSPTRAWSIPPESFSLPPSHGQRWAPNPSEQVFTLILVLTVEFHILHIRHVQFLSIFPGSLQKCLSFPTAALERLLCFQYILSNFIPLRLLLGTVILPADDAPAKGTAYIADRVSTRDQLSGNCFIDMGIRQIW